MNEESNYLSLSLDEIIKQRRTQRSIQNSKRATSRSRGRLLQSQIQRGSQSRRGRIQQQRQQKIFFRGSQHSQRGRRLSRGGSYGPRGRIGLRPWSTVASLKTNVQNQQSRGRNQFGRQSRGLRSNARIRRASGRLPARTLQVRQGGNTQTSQFARNRIRLATSFLLQKKMKFQQLRMNKRIPLLFQSGQRTQRQAFLAAAFRTRGRQTRGGLRGAMLNKLLTRKFMLNKINRAKRNRQMQQQRSILSVSIENERALTQQVDRTELPQMVVTNPLANRNFATSMIRVPARPRMRTSMATPRIIAQQIKEEINYDEPSTSLMSISQPGRRLTLHERFSQFQ